ncbi:Uncharacterized protein APZ42_008636, partial [Daphnia magna]
PIARLADACHFNVRDAERETKTAAPNGANLHGRGQNADHHLAGHLSRAFQLVERETPRRRHHQFTGSSRGQRHRDEEVLRSFRR